MASHMRFDVDVGRRAVACQLPYPQYRLARIRRVDALPPDILGRFLSLCIFTKNRVGLYLHCVPFFCSRACAPDIDA